MINEEEQEQEKFKAGDRIIFDSACDEQVDFGGCDDPRKILKQGKVYEIESIDIHN